MDKPELRKITEDPKYAWAERKENWLKALLRAKRIESSGRRGLRGSARKRESKMASLLAGQNVAIAQITAFRAWEQHRGERFRQARQDHAAVPGRRRRVRQYDSSPQFLHAERASPQTPCC